MRPALVWTAVLAVLLTVLAACSNDAKRDGQVDVVASFFPLVEVARSVGGSEVRVTSLTRPGVEPHDLELTTGQVVQARQAQLVIYLGHGFQPAVQELVKGVKGEVIDGLAAVQVVEDDPHVWLDPSSMTRIVVAVREALTRVDPDHEAAFAANARRYIERLSALDASFSTGLDDCDRNVVVTSHAAYRYLTARYGLEQEAVAGTSPASAPTPARLSELTTLVRDAGITTIFTEPLVAGGPAAELARQTGIPTATLDPVEGAPRGAPAATYEQQMRGNLATLRRALGCR
jgi:zinc transport system substrate-binding protein